MKIFLLVSLLSLNLWATKTDPCVDNKGKDTGACEAPLRSDTAPTLDLPAATQKKTKAKAKSPKAPRDTTSQPNKKSEN